MYACCRVSAVWWVALTAMLLTVSLHAWAEDEGSAASQVPPRTNAGQALVVPEQHVAIGEVYHVHGGNNTQFTWTLEAPAARIVARCNRVVGYIVGPFDIEAGQPPIVSGAFRIPLASLSTGVDRLDREMRGEQALDADHHPELTLVITDVSDAKLEEEDGRRKYDVALRGEFSARGVHVPVETRATLTFFPFTWGTMQINLGDFYVLRTRFVVQHSDLGIPQPPRADPDLQPRKGEVELCLLCSTVSPEKNIDPSVPNAQHAQQLKLLTLLRDLNDPQRGYAFGREYLKTIWDDAAALARLARLVLTEDGIERRDLAFVERAAARASELTDGKDPFARHALARLCYERGDLEGALTHARAAVEHLGDRPPYEAAPIRSALKHFESEAQARVDSEDGHGR